MAIKDVRSKLIYVNYIPTTTLVSGLVGGTFDSMQFGSLIGMNLSFIVESYGGQPMILTFEQSDDAGFVTAEPVLANEIIDEDSASFTIGVEIAAQEVIPSWGFIGLKRYFRLRLALGAGSDVSAIITCAMTDKPTQSGGLI